MRILRWIRSKYHGMNGAKLVALAVLAIALLFAVFIWRSESVNASQRDICEATNKQNEVLRGILNASNAFVQTSRVRTPDEKEIVQEYYDSLLALVPPHTDC